MKTESLNKPIFQKKINLEKVPKPYLEVAQGMETQFINQMMNEMRKTVHKETPDSSAVEYYNSLQDYERAKIMAENGNGVGLKELVLQDLLPQHLLDRATNSNIPKAKAFENYQQTKKDIAADPKENL